MASTVRVLLLELCTLDTGVRSSVLSGFTVFGREEETPSTGHCDWTRGTSPGAQKVVVCVSVSWFGLRVLAAPKYFIFVTCRAALGVGVLECLHDRRSV